jgi:hypothetical protein
LSAVCGLAVLDHLHLGGVTPSLRPDAGAGLIDRVGRMVRRHFGPAPVAAED